jgi:ribosome-binding ATPase YchF (GTP1/OBG family)
MISRSLELKLPLKVQVFYTHVGKYTQKGKEYIVSDGDICYFKVGQIQKKK